MITTVFLSNNIIQAATGERSRGSYQVKGIYHWEMPQGSLLNGMITDEGELVEQLTAFWREFRLPVSNVELVVNGLAFSIRRLTFPTTDPKKLETLIPLEYEEAEAGVEPIYDFMPYSRKSKSEIKAVMAVRATVSQTEKWVELFKKIDVELAAITVSNVTIQKYLKQEEALQQGAHIVLGIDDNSLNTYLWLDGRQKNTGTKRFFSDKGTPEFGVEIARKVSELQQFYRTLQSDTPLEEIHTFGFKEDSLNALRDSLRDAGMEMRVEALGGEYVDEIAAVGNFISWEKDVNLLQALNRHNKKKKKKAYSLKSLAVPAVLLGICLLATAVLAGINIYKGSRVRSLEDYVMNPFNQEQIGQVDALNAEIASMQQILNQANQVRGMIDSYPRMNSSVVGTIQSAAGAGVTPKITAYDAKTGDLTVEVTAAQVTDCNTYVTALKGTGVFYSVEYSGYNYDDKEAIYKVQLHCFLTEQAGK